MKKKQSKRNRQRKPEFLVDFGDYLNFWHRYLKNRIYAPFSYFESAKDVLVNGLYKNRGKNARPILHIGAMATAFGVVILGPMIFNRGSSSGGGERGGVLAATSDEVSFYTMQAEEVRQLRGGEITVHEVKDGETLESIAVQYGLKEETIVWENGLKDKEKLTIGQQLRILPIDGVRHKVAKGETVASVGKKYGLEDAQVQAIVDFPFNDFVNDETFELATGQYLMVPGGAKPKDKVLPRPTFATVMTPSAGAVSATGAFVWPAAGRITQSYSFYHKAIDIAGSGAILAVDSGTVVASGWDPSGYGNRVIVDHNNGTKTLYAHMSVLQVSNGQTVNKSDILGQMGSTGRSTGVHLHFEIRQDAVLLNPLSYLK